MKAVVLTGLRQFQLRDMPRPVIEKDNEVLLKVEKVGVCGSDVHYFKTGRIGSGAIDFPFMMGHEFSATVVETGNTVRRVRPGDEVAVDPAQVCHVCDQCLKDRENTCRKISFLGCPGQEEGCLCEYIVMPEYCLFPTNGKITLDEAILSEPMSVCIYAVKLAQLPPESDIAILGAGPIGLGILIAAQQKKIKTAYVTDRIDHRAQTAKDAKATWAGNPDRQDVVKEILQCRPEGLDTVFECAGEQDTLDQAIDMLKPGGKLIMVGINLAERVTFSSEHLRRKEISIISVRRQNNCVQPTIDMFADDKINVDFMITHRFQPEQTQEAFEMVSDYRDGVIKAIIEF